MVAPLDVWRDRRGEVDQPGKEGGERRELRERGRASHGAKSMRARVQAEAPGRGVAPRGQDVAPVLGDEPDPAEQGGGRDVPVAVDAVRQEGGDQREQQAGAEVPLVHAGTEDVDPRAQAMTFDSEHKPR